MQKYHWVIFGIIFCLMPGCGLKKSPKQDNYILDSEKTNLPQDLCYKNKPIADEYMACLVPVIGPHWDEIEIDVAEKISKRDDGLVDEFEWSYVGTLANGDHIIQGSWSPADGQGSFTGISIIRRTGNKFRIIDHFPKKGGGDHWTAIHNCSLHENMLCVHQRVTWWLLYEQLIEQYPELSLYVENKAEGPREWLLAEWFHIGDAVFEAVITPEGKVENYNLKSFTMTDDDGKLLDSNDQEYPLKNSLELLDAFDTVMRAYFHKNKSNTLEATQLKDALIEACVYTKEKEKVL